jgi:hypothetical protein
MSGCRVIKACWVVVSCACLPGDAECWMALVRLDVITRQAVEEAVCLGRDIGGLDAADSDTNLFVAIPHPRASLLCTMPSCFFPAAHQGARTCTHTGVDTGVDTQQCKHARASATRARSDLRTIGGGTESFAPYHHALAASAAHPASHQRRQLLGGDAQMREHPSDQRLLDCIVQEHCALGQPLLPRGRQSCGF